MKKIDRFVIRQLLSEGSNGSVYAAEEQLPGALTRPVALKILPAASASDPKAEQRFVDEIKVLIALAGHPNVVPVYAMGLADSTPWMALEWVPSSLAQTLREQPAPAEQVAEMMRQVATGLTAVHGLPNCVLHNDLTPGNILVDRFGGYKISDFGLAAPASVERTRVLATVRYAAPELLSHDFGPLAPATDLYALGHIAYEMALGGKLYRAQFPAVFGQKAAARDATPAKWMAWHCSLETRPPAVHDALAGFPPALGDVIAKLMRKDAGGRYATADALLTDLRQATSPAVPAAPATAAPGKGNAPAPPPLPGSGFGAAAARPVPQAAPAHESPADAAYYVRLGARTLGPFDFAALQRLVQRGEVSRLHKVSVDRIAWRNISTIEGLFS